MDFFKILWNLFRPQPLAEMLAERSEIAEIHRSAETIKKNFDSINERIDKLDKRNMAIHRELENLATLVAERLEQRRE
jgi:prefoldin subunit 5